MFHVNRTFIFHDAVIGYFIVCTYVDVWKINKWKQANKKKKKKKRQNRLIHRVTTCFKLLKQYIHSILSHQFLPTWRVNISKMTKINKFKNRRNNNQSGFCMFFTKALCPVPTHFSKEPQIWRILFKFKIRKLQSSAKNK